MVTIHYHSKMATRQYNNKRDAVINESEGPYPIPLTTDNIEYGPYMTNLCDRSPYTGDMLTEVNTANYVIDDAYQRLLISNYYTSNVQISWSKFCYKDHKERHGGFSRDLLYDTGESSSCNELQRKMGLSRCQWCDTGRYTLFPAYTSWIEGREGWPHRHSRHISVKGSFYESGVCELCVESYKSADACNDRRAQAFITYQYTTGHWERDMIPLAAFWPPDWLVANAPNHLMNSRPKPPAIVNNIWKPSCTMPEAGGWVRTSTYWYPDRNGPYERFDLFVDPQNIGFKAGEPQYTLFPIRGYVRYSAWKLTVLYLFEGAYEGVPMITSYTPEGVPIYGEPRGNSERQGTDRSPLSTLCGNGNVIQLIESFVHPRGRVLLDRDLKHRLTRIHRPPMINPFCLSGPTKYTRYYYPNLPKAPTP